MKKYFISVCTILFVLLYISCNTGETVVKWPNAPSFPAPASVTVTSVFGGTAYKIQWSIVSKALDYQMFIMNEGDHQISLIDYKSITGNNSRYEQTISITNFNNLGFYFSSGKRIGIRAVSVDGVFSPITWSNII